MAQTPNSSSSSYLSAAEFLKRKDWRTVADFCSDNDTRLTQGALLTNANLQSLLDDAAGLVECACLPANRYTPADLAALTGVGQKLLYRLIADLAEGLMIERRPDKKRPVPPSFERAMGILDALRTGEKIFPLQEAMNAGNVATEQESERDVTDRNLTVTQAARFFGRRANRNPPFASS